MQEWVIRGMRQYQRWGHWVGGGQWGGVVPEKSSLRCLPCSPVIRQIRQACAEPFEAFEECLRQNEVATGNCAEQMRRFLQCAEQVQPARTPATVQVKT